MTNILKAFGIVFVVSVVLLGILKLLGLANADNAKLALTPFAAITLVYSKIEENAKLKKEHGKLQTFSDFSYPFWKVLVLGTISGVAIIEATAGLAAALAVVVARKLLTFSVLDMARIVAVALMPVIFYLVFAVGRWVGVRAKDHGFLAAALIGSLFKLIDFGLTVVQLSSENFRNAYGFERTNIPSLIKLNLIGVLLPAGICVLGCWVGIRRRQARYLEHLLKSIAPASREAIIDIAYEEAQKTLSVAPQLAK
jgi:hypothetical protein